MKIYKPIGSKERFVEVFQRVNKVKLNENLMEVGSPNLNPENVLNMSFNQLKNKQLKIEHSNTQTKGDQNFVELLCTDNQGNNITFIFRAISSEGDQEGVYNINNVLLNSFSFDSADGEDTVEMQENALGQFNAQHANELLDVVQNYVDVENPENAELEEAVKLIDAIKQNSYPFGGGDERLQTGKNYGDKKPTNDKVRVSSPELDKFVQETIQEYDKPEQKLTMPIAGIPSAIGGVVENDDDDIESQELNRFKQEIQPQNPEEIDVEDEPVPDVSPEKKDKILMAYENLTARNKPGYSPTTAEVMAELDKMAGKVMKKTPRPPIDFSNYVVDETPVQSEQSKQSIIRQAAQRVAEDLKRTGKPYVYDEFISLVKEEALNLYNNIQKMSLAEGENVNYPDPLGKEFKTKEHFPKQKKKRSKKVKISEEDTYGDEDITGLPEVPSGVEAEKQARSDMYNDPDYHKHGFSEDSEENPETDDIEIEPETDDGMSNEPEGDEIAQIAQDKEQAGEMIPGGKGEGLSPSEFSPDQILKGMKVEMEHSDDPMIALEITLDHLAEDPEYYTEKDTPEASAQFGAAKDTENGGEGDKEMTDLLLGFEPHNVGDEVDIEGDEEPEVTAPEVPEPANEPEKTPAEDAPEEKEKLTENKKVITEEQIKIAKMTLSNRQVPTGMTKKEAVTILMNNNLRKIL